jgi:hypothetical protein
MKLKSIAMLCGLLFCVARAQADCKPTQPLETTSLRPTVGGEVLLFKSQGYADAVKGYKNPTEIASDENSFGFVDQNFCIRKGHRDREYFQTCRQGTARIEFQAGKSGVLEFGVIGDEVAVMVPVDAKFEDVIVKNGAVTAAGNVVNGLNEPLCMGRDGRASAPGTPMQSIEVSDLSKTKTYLVRIVGGYFVGATVNDMKDLILKINVQDISPNGVTLKYEVLSNRGGQQAR